MSELKYMKLSLKEILINLYGCIALFDNQKDAIDEFRKIILQASNKRDNMDGAEDVDNEACEVKDDAEDVDNEACEVKDTVGDVDKELYDAEDVDKELYNDEDKKITTIFLAGAGRSGAVAKAFAMRLMHLGFYVYVFGESIAPPVNDGDIIIIVSKSGKSNSITKIVEDSKMNNVKFLAVCGSEDCDLAQISDAKIIIDSLPQKCIKMGEEEPLELTLMGCAFELSAFVLLDALICELMENLNLREKDLKDFHDVLSSSI